MEWKCPYPYVPKTVGTSAYSDSMGHYVSVCKSYLDIFPCGFHFTGSEFYQAYIRISELQRKRWTFEYIWLKRIEVHILSYTDIKQSDCFGAWI